MMRALSSGERALFRLTHDMRSREEYAVDLLRLCFGWSQSKAQRFWDDESAGKTASVLGACEQELVRDPISPLTDVLAQDSFTSSVMAVCELYRVSLTEFSGWPATDQELAIAYYIESRDTCPGCRLSKRLRTQYVKLASEPCVHCQQIKEATDSIPEALRAHTHLTIKADPYE